jgi:hypothetical protein
MEVHRVAEVYAAAEGAETGIRGSGYLISPALVLTARHVVSPAISSGSCRVRFFNRNRQQLEGRDAEIVWVGKDLDAALLGPVKNEPFLQEATPVEFGELVGLKPVQVDAVGFAEALTREKNGTDTLPVYGTCHPLDSMKSNRMHIKVLWAAPTDSKDWKGESGAVVFAGDVLVGVVEEVPDTFDSDVLRAVPVKALITNAEFQDQCIKSGISLKLRSVNAAYVSSLPDISWDEVRQRYLDEVVRTGCRFELTGLSIAGSPEERVLNANGAYSGMRFRLDSAPDKPFGLSELLSLGAAVLLGKPGSGKSGTLKMLLFRAAREQGLVPILLPLSHLAIRPDISATGIVESIADQAASRFLVPEATSQFFWRMLSQGRCFVSFDALDELPTRAIREKALLAIRELCDKSPGNRFFLTSRNAEYDETPVPAPLEKNGISFKRVEITELDEAQIRGYLRVWFNDDSDIMTRILDRPELMEMHPAPLLLNLMGRLARNRRLPMDKFTLYDEFVQTSLNAWEEIKGPDPSAPPLGVRRDALEKLAWTAHKMDVVLEHMALDAVATVRGVKDPANVLNWLARRSGILKQQLQPGKWMTRTSYHFAHHQLQEFLTGCELGTRLLANFEETSESFAPHLYDNWWDQALRFAIIRLQQSSDKHNELLMKVLMSTPQRSERVALRAARLLGECDPEFIDEAVAKRITDELVNLCKTLERYEFPNGQLNEIFALAERGFGPACDVIEQIALDRGASRALLSKSYDSECRHVDAVWFLVHKGAASAQEAITRALSEIMRFDQRIRLARCWAMLGRPQNAKELLTEDFTRRLGVERVEGCAFLSLLRALTDLGFIEEADSLAKRHLAHNGPNLIVRLECGLWLLEHLNISSDVVFKIALETLPHLPKEERHDHDAVNDAIELAITVWETNDGPARKLLCESLSNIRYAWPYVMEFSHLENEIGEAARKGQEVIINESWDCSRRNGMISSIICDDNDDRAVTRMLRVIENDWVLRRWGGEILDSLLARGRQEEAMVVSSRIPADHEQGTRGRRAKL